jgi:hypothetical protein
MSSLKDLASLIMIPSLVKDGRLDTVKPLGNSIIHPDATGNNDGTDGSTPAEGNFTFSRGSNLAATRVDVNGLIEKGRENLLLQSNNFDTTWVNANSSETSGQADKDGGTNAWKIDLTGVSGRIYQSKSQSGVVSFSVYAKKGTLDWVILSSNIVDASFNLATGEKGTLVAGITSSIEDIGGGWYRCSCTGSGAFTQFRIYPAIADNTFTATSGNIYIQDAQAETSLVATDYIETGASTAQAGILEDLPRLDYSGGASCPALLLEPQRTNFINHSEYIAAGVTWSAASGMTSQNNSVVSPEGVQNATKLIRPNSTGAAWVREGNISATIGLNQVVSVFAKSGSNNILNITYYDQTAGDLFFNYDLSNGTIYSAPTSSAYYVDAGIEDYGNGWYRCYAIAEAGRVDPQFQLSVGVNRGGAANSYLYVYGASHEKDVSHPTSYIPTMGSAVTRSGDAASLTGVADLLGDGSGTLYVEAEYFEDNAHIALGDGTLDNIFPFRFRTSNFQNDMKVAGVSQGNLVKSSISINNKYKVAISYATDYRAMYFDGTFIDEDLSLNTFPDGTLTRIGFDRGDGLSNFYGRIYQVLVFPTALTNAELAALTA